MNIIQNLTTVNRTVTANRKIEYIVVHYFGALGTAQQTCAYFKSVNRRASAHYFVDNASVWQCVEDKYASWHCGDSGTGTHKSRCNNSNSIGIEVAPRKVSTKTMSAGDKDWYFNAQTIANLSELVKSLMATYNIDIDHVIRHYDVTSKLCPRPWVGDDINTYYGKSGNQLWREFKAGLTAESEEEMKKYYTVDEMPLWARTTMQKLLDRKYVTEFGFTEEALRMFVINDRAGLYK